MEFLHSLLEKNWGKKYYSANDNCLLQDLDNIRNLEPLASELITQQRDALTQLKLEFFYSISKDITKTEKKYLAINKKFSSNLNKVYKKEVLAYKQK